MARTGDTEVGKITTSAPEAYKYYSEGRKVSIKGDYRQAIPFLEKAVEIDPEFAMAYRALAGVYRNIGETEESKKNLEKALELSDRVSVREQYLIEADFYRVVEEDYDKAIMLNPKSYNKSWIYYLQGDFVQMEKECEEMLEREVS